MFPWQGDKEVPVVSRILLPLRLQLKKAQMCLSHVVLKLWAFLWRRCGEFCKMILAYILTKSNWRKSWSRLNTRSVVCSWIGLSNNLKMIRIFIEKSSSAMIPGWMASLINKICIIGQTTNHTYSMSHHRIRKKITVWCGLWAGGVIVPYFFHDDQDGHVSVNGNLYRSMISEYFWPKLDDVDLEDMWFQQDGAKSHTVNATINLLETNFGERVISRNGPVGWPPRSCDLTPFDYFLWATSSLWSKPTSQWRLMNFVRISNVKLQQYRPIYAWKSSKIGFSVWTSASVPVVAMQKKSSLIHNRIERTFTRINNFIDIQNSFCFI